MTELSLPGASLAIALAVVSALVSRIRDDRSRRLLAVASALAILLVSCLPVLELEFRDLPEGYDPWLTACRIDELSAVLLPFVASLFAIVFTVCPRREADAVATRRCFHAEAAMLALVVSRSAPMIATLWCVLIGLFLIDLRDGAPRRAFLVAVRYLGLSATCIIGGVLALAYGHGTLGLTLVLVAAMIRKGVVPFHGWMPELFEHGKLGPTLLFSVPQVAAYVVVRLVIPTASATHLALIGTLSLVTAVYGACAFMVQKDARRAFGYFFMSQSALVMAGLDCTSIDGIVGGLSLWLSSGVALAGMGAALWMLESRRGRLSIDRFWGGYDNKPLLATSFLLLGLASVGFPGTLGFVAQELLIAGAVTQFPHVGFAVVLATSLCAVGVLRMFFALFAGKGEARVRTRLRPRELVAMTTLVVVLLVGGLVPQPITALETRVAQGMIEGRGPIAH